MSDSKIFSDGSITQYLLGVLPEEETERLEEESICDSAFFDRIEAVEQELIKAFLDKKLSLRDEAQFKSKYLSTPALRSKVRFAEDLRLLAREALSRKRPRKSGWFSWPRITVPLLAGASAMALLIGTLTFSLHRRPDTTTNVVSQTGHTGAAAVGVVSLLLLPGSEKSGEARERRVVIHPDTGKVVLEFQVPGNAPPRANIELVRVAEPTDEKRLNEAVEGRPAEAGRLFVLSVAAGELPDGNYIAYLRRWPSTAQAEPDESFVFSVGRSADRH
jgi:hypothetical protein